MMGAIASLDRGGGPKGRRGCSSHHTKERRNYHGHQIGNENVTAPNADLTKSTVDTAAKAIVDSKIFATTEGGNLTALKSSQIVTRKVETLE